MEQFFQTLLTMTATASIAAVAVMLLRLPLKKAPRWITCLLWLVVVFRMVCPVSFEAPVSIVPEAVSQGTYDDFLTERHQETLPVEVTPVEPGVYQFPVTTEVTYQQEPHLDIQSFLFPLWAIGLAAMVLWSAVSYGKLRRRIADALRVEGNLYESDAIDSPFVCGFLKPRIYLPARLDEAHRKYVLLHEEAHIKRLDHLTKALFWLALCIHWFNPILWAAYILYGRDVETACDQAVIRHFDREDTAGYAAALLHLSRETSQPRAVPLAFGEQDAKGRIQQVLRYHPRGVVVASIAVVVCILTGIVLLADPGGEPSPVAKGPQLEGLAVTHAAAHYAPHQVVELTEDLRMDLVALLDRHGHLPYEPLDSYTPTETAIQLMGEGPGAAYYFEPDLLTLTRVNQDGYSAQRKAAPMNDSLAADPAYQAWREALAEKLRYLRADELYALKTPYIGDPSAVSEILRCSNLAIATGTFTMELQTSTEPYGLTLHLENFHPFTQEQAEAFAYVRQMGPVILALIDNAGTLTVSYSSPLGSSSGITIEADPAHKNLTQEEFRELFAETCNTPYPVFPWGYTPSEVLYLSPEAQEEMAKLEDDPFDHCVYNIAPHIFRPEFTRTSRSHWPESPICEDPIYKANGSPDAIVARDGTVIDLRGYDNVEEVIVYDSDCQDTFYRIYRLNFDEETWVSHWTMDQQGMALEYLLRVEPTHF